ncbi:hypothetical protein [Marisediminicola senii]|uniref:hypothetical protein n=1 Tax=Marisediminicola senii TaxID=2711233 RepID=UPI0013EA875F|nr:hypothetical protein [Marisediminicola senii]
MSLLAVVAAAIPEEGASELSVFLYPAISAIVFTALAFVTWSFRDVANRHSHKTQGSAGHGGDHH